HKGSVASQREAVAREQWRRLAVEQRDEAGECMQCAIPLGAAQSAAGGVDGVELLEQFAHGCWGAGDALDAFIEARLDAHTLDMDLLGFAFDDPHADRAAVGSLALFGTAAAACV
ncbi:hypothetical protein ONR57_20300, partial [Hoyosella sp. YIM 151337]|uniref:hypothetical protein n=1 Tax=Hoyosella sp. YIM 151337 TaxID=2992742 RepID=UPI0022356017